MSGVLDSSITNIVSCTDSFGRPLGATLSPYGSTPYKCYTGTLSVGVSPLVLDVHNDLGRFGSRLYMVNNTSGTDFTVAFSVDGTNYGDEIPVRATYAINYDYFIPFKKMRLTRNGADALYDITVI